MSLTGSFWRFGQGQVSDKSKFKNKCEERNPCPEKAPPGMKLALLCSQDDLSTECI